MKTLASDRSRFRRAPSLSPNSLSFKKLKNLSLLQGVRADVKHIACEACEALASHASRYASQLREEKKKDAEGEGGESPSSMPPSRFKRAPLAKGVLTEAEILDAVESMADPDADAGEWLAHLDLEVVDGGKKLKLKNMGERGKCGTRCRTVAMAVADSLEGADTDLAERLWRGGREAGPEEVAKWLCKEATSACLGTPPPPLPAARAAALAKELSAEPFAPESADDAQLRTMMASMKGSGMGGQMFDRNSVMKSLKEGDEDDDEEEEEEEKGGERDEKAAQEAKMKSLLDNVIAEEEAKRARGEMETPPSSAPAASDFSEKAERAKAAAREGFAPRKGGFLPRSLLSFLLLRSRRRKRRPPNSEKKG